jgi:hypothetical protein
MFLDYSRVVGHPSGTFCESTEVTGLLAAGVIFPWERCSAESRLFRFGWGADKSRGFQ